MKISRAYIAGIGTTAVIVAAAILMLAVVSTLVAFRGLPTHDAPDPIRSYVLEETSEAPRRAVPAQSARDVPSATDAAAGSRAAAPPAPTVDVRPPPGTGTTAGEGSSPPPRERSPRRDAPAQGDPDRRDRPRKEPVAPPADRPQPGVPKAPPPHGPQVDPPTGLEFITRSLGRTTAGVTRVVGDVLVPLSPSLGASVEGAGEALARRLHEVGASQSRARAGAQHEPDGEVVDPQILLKRAVMSAGEDD